MLEEQRGPIQEDLLDQSNIRFAGKMREKWRAFRIAFGEDERYWRLHENEKLRQMQEQVSGFITECEEELTKHPLPERSNYNIVSDWQNALTFVNKKIAKFIADKS